MDNELVDENKYPLRVSATRIHILVRRECPCIVFFSATPDWDNEKILDNTTLISRRYPKVFAYYVGWLSHKNYYQTINPSDKYDVTVWKSSRKIIVISKPNLKQLEELYQYVQMEIDGPSRYLYLHVLKQDKNLNEKRKKRREKRMENEIGNNKTQPPNTLLLLSQAKFKRSTSTEIISPDSPAIQNTNDIRSQQNCAKITLKNINFQLCGHNKSQPTTLKTNNILITPQTFNNIKYSNKSSLDSSIISKNDTKIESKRSVYEIQKNVHLTRIFSKNAILSNSKMNFDKSINNRDIICSKLDKILYQQTESQSTLPNSKIISNISSLASNRFSTSIKVQRSKRKQKRPNKITRCLFESSLH